MSAYIVDRHHVAYLAKIAAEKCVHCRFWFGSHPIPEDRLALTFANILAAENIRSIHSRYSDTNPDGADAWKGTGGLPGDPETAEPWTLSELESLEWKDADKNPSQILAALRCYEYQACESDDWTRSDAYRLCSEITRQCASDLAKGNDVEESWNAPFPIGYVHPVSAVEDEEAEELPEWFVSREEEPDDAARARAMLKRLGYNSRKVSVRCRHSSVIFTVRDASVDLGAVHAVADTVRRVRYCEYSQEILSGGNTFTDVETTDDVKRELSEPFLFAAFEAIKEARGLRDGCCAVIEVSGNLSAYVTNENGSLRGRINIGPEIWLPNDDHAAARTLAYRIATHRAN
jgi:hypothetical protein